MTQNLTPAIQKLLDKAVTANLITPKARENATIWLNEPRYQAYASQVADLITAAKWQELDDAFWTTIPFGTAGRRGKMYPIGTNAINERTMGESARGLADCLLQQRASESSPSSQPLRCAIAYDTRHRSRQFAELCAEILVAADIEVLFLDGHRATPELAFTVREMHCDAGIMISASHNPPSDNAIKVFWNDGAQVRPPHDAALIDFVNRVGDIPRIPFAQGVAEKRVRFVQKEMDIGYQRAVLKMSQGTSIDAATRQNLRILYSPLHGVGRTSVEPVLRSAGFTNVKLFGPQSEPDGDFPNVPQHVANPENPAVFDALIEEAKRLGADLVLASDPDADRIGAAALISSVKPSEWGFITGNQLGVLMGEWLLQNLQKTGTLSPQHFIVKTLVTSNMLVRLAESYGIKTVTEVLTGFKWIGLEIDRHGPEKFVLGTEEAHGYLAGTHIRDKDAAVAALILAEYAATLKPRGKTLFDELDRLYQRVGLHIEKSFALTLPGADGMERMRTVMGAFRSAPPSSIAKIDVNQVRDYKNQTVMQIGQRSRDTKPFAGPQSDMIFLDLAIPHHSIAIRPSGTEPKLKFYLCSALSPAESGDLNAAKKHLNERLSSIEKGIREFVAEIP
jgi:phosphoglucomutase/phosphomannomutase